MKRRQRRMTHLDRCRVRLLIWNVNMFHPHARTIDLGSDIGTALVATQPIPAGTVLWALCEFDIVLDRSRIAELSRPYREVLDRYAFISPTGDCILQWDLAR